MAFKAGFCSCLLLCTFAPNIGTSEQITIFIEKT